MHIAILVSGRLNEAIARHSHIQERLVQGNTVDFFFSFTQDTHTPELIQQVTDLYKPKGVSINTKPVFPYDDYYHKRYFPTNMENTVCMYYNRQKLLDTFIEYVEKNQVRYDIVISTRFDLVYETKLELPLVHITSSRHMLMIPANEDCPPLKNAIYDQFAVSSVIGMIQYLSVFNQLPIILDNITLFHPESILYGHLKRNRANITRFHYPARIERV